MAQDFPKTLRTLYRGCRGWTVYWFTDNDAAVSNIERQCHEICNSGHGSPSQSYQSLRSAGTASNFPRAFETGGLQLSHLRSQKFIRHDQRRHRLPGITTASRDGLICCDFKPISACRLMAFWIGWHRDSPRPERMFPFCSNCQSVPLSGRVLAPFHPR
jgi:hypothetical protein